MSLIFERAKEITPYCDSIRYFSKDYFDRNKKALLNKGLPFIVTECFPQSNSVDIYKIIEEYFGDNLISVRSYSNTLEYATNRYYEKINVHDYLASLNEYDNSVVPYAANNEIDTTLLNLLNIEIPIKQLQNKFEKPKLWIGAKGNSTPLHRDSSDNFTYHLIGKKKWTLFSVKDEAYLYFEKNSYGIKANALSEFAVSEVDLDHIDLTRFPLFNKATKHEIIANEGEMLYLPYGWGHHVENISSSVMINLWFKLENYTPLILEGF